MNSFNLALLEELRTLLSENFPVLIDTYINDTSKRVASLGLAIEAEDWTEVKNIAHVMKSSSANIGALAFADISSNIEAAAVQNIDVVRVFYDKLLIEFDSVLMCLNEHR